MQTQRIAITQATLAVFIAVGLLLGPAGIGPNGPSAEAALRSEVKKLLASDAESGDEFGFSVAVSGDTAVVGAINEDTEGNRAGAAYVYQRDAGGADNWGEVKKLVASDPRALDFFGHSVAIRGDTVVVGAPILAVPEAGPGTAYVFERDEGGAGNWGEVKKLTASDAQDLARFGFSVTVSGDTALVGADLHDAQFIGNNGAVYLFERDEGGVGNWGEAKKLVASDGPPGGLFGRGVAVSGDTAIVGANGAVYFLLRDQGGAGNWGEVEKVTGPFGGKIALSGDTVVLGIPLDDGVARNAGAAFVLERDAGGPNDWGQVKKLVPPDALPESEFGTSVAISGDAIVVGAHQEDAPGNLPGAAYVFGRDEGGADNWGVGSTTLLASDGQNNDEGGFSVGISGDTAIMGARGEDDGGSNAGAAYVFGDLFLPKLTCPPSECVGGNAELPDVAGKTPLEAEGSAVRSTTVVAGIVAAVTAVAVGLGGAAWYARRRRG